MNNHELPPYFDNSFQSIFANFGLRFAAVLLDGLILAPMTLVALIMNNANLYNFYYTIPVTSIVTLLYFTYLPVKFGATPGKRILGMTILTTSGNKIDFADAFKKYLPQLLLSIIGISCNLVAVQLADSEIYNSGTWLEKSEYLASLNQRMYYSQMALSYLFMFTNLFVFLSNSRRRSISDLSGNTVVVMDQFLDKVESFKNPKSSL
jgi:uncharacterized RDD family membrane protein YckC